MMNFFKADTGGDPARTATGYAMNGGLPSPLMRPFPNWTPKGMIGPQLCGAMTGGEHQAYLNALWSFNASNFQFPTDLFGYDQLQRGTALTEGRASLGSDKSGYKLIGFFSRLNYDWQNRFLLMGSVRYEGNSRFGASQCCRTGST